MIEGESQRPWGLETEFPGSEAEIWETRGPHGKGGAAELWFRAGKTFWFGAAREETQGESAQQTQARRGLSFYFLFLSLLSLGGPPHLRALGSLRVFIISSPVLLGSTGSIGVPSPGPLPVQGHLPLRNHLPWAAVPALDRLCVPPQCLRMLLSHTWWPRSLTGRAI